MRFAPLTLAVVLLAGCGYALVGRGSNIPEDIREVYVQPFENRTQRSLVDQALTRAVAEEMVTRQRFAVVASADEADAILSGAVVNFGVIPVTFDPEGRATEYEIVIAAQIIFRRPGDPTEGEGEAQVIWSNDRYSFRESYPVDPTAADFFDREDEAIEEAAERFAETMVSDLLEGF